MRMHNRPCADFRVTGNYHMGKNPHTVAKGDVRANHGKGPDLDISSERGAVLDNSRRMDSRARSSHMESPTLRAGEAIRKARREERCGAIGRAAQRSGCPPARNPLGPGAFASR